MDLVYQISLFPDFNVIKVTVLFSILGPVVLAYAIKNKNSSRRVFAFFWGGIATIVAPLMLIFVLLDHVNTYWLLGSEELEIINGKIEVLRTQPEGGHAPGDLIRIGTDEFEIDYYITSPCYHQTISNGGVLSSGKVVTIYVVDKCILKIMVSTES